MLRRSLDVIDDEAGSILVLDPIGPDFRLNEPDAATRALIVALDGRKIDAVLAAVRDAGGDDSEAIDSIGLLNERGLLEDADADQTLPAAVAERYGRQLQFFADTLPPGHTPGHAQMDLQAAHVCILGVGGIGSWAALALSCMGLGAITLVDGDTVELSNLNRQILFTPDDVGRPKAHTAERRLSDFAPATRFVSVNRNLASSAEIADIIVGSSLVIAACDWPPGVIEGLINDACFSRGVAHLGASHLPPLSRVGPLFVPGQTGCARCRDEQIRREYPEFELVHASRSRPGESFATFGPSCAVLGGLLASEACAYLAGVPIGNSHGTEVVLDQRDLSVTRRPVTQLAGCAVCEPASLSIGHPRN